MRAEFDLECFRPDMVGMRTRAREMNSFAIALTPRWPPQPYDLSRSRSGQPWCVKYVFADAPIRPTVPTPFPFSTPTATQAPPDLSGTWAGLCSGTNNGFCTLTLTQTANGLDGTFILSSPPDKLLDVRGNLIGSTITLRSASGVVFTGTLSGSTLSGSYTDIATGKTYSWSVTLSA